MISRPASIMQELHKIHQGPTVLLAEIPAYSIYLARSKSDIVWNGRTYKKTWFEIETISESSSAQVPEVMVHFSNIGGMVEEEVLENDNFAGADATLSIVNTNCLAETEPVYSVTLQLQKVTCPRDTVSFKLGLTNPLMLGFPSWKFHDSICQYAVFKGDLCGYAGEKTTCNRSLSDCIERNNVERFGAQLGIMGAIQDDDGL